MVIRRPGCFASSGAPTVGPRLLAAVINAKVPQGRRNGRRGRFRRSPEPRPTGSKRRSPTSTGTRASLTAEPTPSQDLKKALINGVPRAP